MLPSQQAEVNGQRLVLQVAKTADERRRGLSHRQSVPDGTGMLFLFPKAGYHSFWMKDTYVPLVVYWLDITGQVVDRAGMLPGDLRSYMPSIEASMAIEVPVTWAAKHPVRYGDRFRFR